MQFFFYNLVLTLAYPLLWLYFWTKSLHDDRYTGTLDERLGRYGGRLTRPETARRIWIHAVSVGEAVAAMPLINNILSNMPGLDVIVSSTTKAGRELVSKTYGSKVRRLYFPLDFPWAAKRAVKAVNADLLVLMETEIWPNVISQCIKRRMPVLLLNGRVSDRMAAAGGIVRGMYKWAFSRMDALCMQTEADAQRLITLGAPPEKVQVIGNMKFDGLISDLDKKKIAELEKLINPKNRPLFVAGSTHPGEEELVIEAFSYARETSPDLLLVIAPRHIERADEVLDLARGKSLKTILRSKLSRPGFIEPPGDAVILDTIGELRCLYALADACFVGGSLIERGGHNVLEPAACGKAPFYGPHTANFRDSVHALERAGAGRPVVDGRDLAVKLAACLQNEAERLRVDNLALEALKANSGAAARAFDMVVKHI